MKWVCLCRIRFCVYYCLGCYMFKCITYIFSFFEILVPFVWESLLFVSLYAFFPMEYVFSSLYIKLFLKIYWTKVSLVPIFCALVVPDCPLLFVIRFRWLMKNWVASVKGKLTESENKFCFWWGFFVMIF